MVFSEEERSKPADWGEPLLGILAFLLKSWTRRYDDRGNLLFIFVLLLDSLLFYEIFVCICVELLLCFSFVRLVDTDGT